MATKSVYFANLQLLPLITSSLVFTTNPAFATKPSFDCAKADSEIEELICKDEELAALDQKMAEVYKTALDKAPKEELDNLKAFQRGWVKGRNDCWKAEDESSCARANYETRITELQIAYGDLVVPESIFFSCEESEDITAVFYQETQLPAAVLTHLSDQVIAFLTPTGSGSKYEGQNVTFWTQGDEAMVTWMGDEFTCSTQ